jgi:kynurenine formamidase
MRLLWTTIIGACLVWTGTAAAGIDETRLVDLTHPFDEHTIAWPTNKPFAWEKTAWGTTAAGYWYASGDFTMSEHGGTHMDAPIHFGKDRRTLDMIPVRQLVGPAVVIDVAPSVERDRDYRLTVADIAGWEKRHGRIPDGAIVLMRTGWGKHWPDRNKYLGSETPQDAATLHFPGFSREAAEFLARERAIDGVGLDTPSMDHGPSRDFIVHRTLSDANIYGLENVANLDRLPPVGATLIALPIKIAGGTGGPVRIIAILP